MRSGLEEEDDLAIYAQPLSSDDDDVKPLAKPEAASSHATKNPNSKSSYTSPKRPLANTAAASRSKRRKLVDVPDLDTFAVPENPTAAAPFPDWNSSGSQKRRLQKSYANRKYFLKPDAIERRDAGQRLKHEFVSHGEVVKHDKGPDVKGEFPHIAALPVKSAAEKLSRIKTKLDIADLPEAAPVRKGSGFRMPELPEITSSSTTSGTEAASLFDEALSPERKRPRRSTSTSSLSSADSMFILEHEADLMEGFESTDVRCPVCQTAVRDSTLLFVPDNLRSLSFKQQQQFCSQHQQVDAKEQWEERGYPVIHWEGLQASRIPAKLPALKEVINRKAPSFYLEALAAEIQTAKGGRKAIQRYLNEGIVNVAKQGYYGPKGARIMVTAITESLTRTLNKALQSDSVLREAGVGGYVSAVLLPELTLQLVMEDMNLGLGKEKQGRMVLDESTNIGVLLNPDDDHLEREDDE